MIHVEKAKYVDDYKIWCQFNNGENGVIDLEKELWGPVFEPLKDKDNFKKFKVSADLHTITWYNDADFAPEFLYEHMKK